MMIMRQEREAPEKQIVKAFINRFRLVKKLQSVASKEPMAVDAEL